MSLYPALKKELEQSKTSLVAVSKTKPVTDIEVLYNQGQRHFGENRVQELLEKQEQLPPDIEWHFIGTLQRKKVKSIVPFISLIHSVDNFPLLEKIDLEAGKINRKINLLLQFYIATENTKQGFSLEEIEQNWKEKISALENINVLGVMGMASFITDLEQVRKEFISLKNIFNSLKTKLYQDNIHFEIISMGMSGDYKIAIQEGSNMVRIGSLLFGTR